MKRHRLNHPNCEEAIERRCANLEGEKKMIRTIRKHTSSWLSRRTGSQECLDRITDTCLQCAVRCETEFEITSQKVKHHLEKEEYQAVMKMLRELQHNFILKCLESFPFKVLNKKIPKSFPIWETLLMKLQHSEDDHIPKFLYTACDELVLQIGRLLESVKDMPQENADLIHACKRVLKKVYMQYNGVLQPLIKENERIEHAIYSLSLHLPLGTDRSACSLYTAITNEVQACVADYKDAVDRLRDVKEKESQSLTQILGEIPWDMDSDEQPVIEFHAPSLSQIQLQERLYINQCIMRALEPNQRSGNLAQLQEMLKKRITGDKEVIALFGSLRMRNEHLSDMDAVEPWLRKHQRGVECSIAMLKDVEKELNVPLHPPSPTEEFGSSLEDNDIMHVSVSSLQYKSTNVPSDDHLLKPSFIRRGSVAVPMLVNIGEKEGEDEMDVMARRHSVPPHCEQRPRSASPMKLMRTNGMNRTNGTQNGTIENWSCKSLNSSHSSNRSLNARENSSSIHDLNSSELQQPMQAFRRAKSLKAKGSYAVTLLPPQPLVAGRKKAATLHQSSTNLSTISNGNSSKLKKMFRSGSAGLVSRMDTHQQQRENGVHVSPDVLLELEFKSEELKKRDKMIYDLQTRERELTDRLSDQAQRQLQDGEKFEDILGPCRPTVMIQLYEELYTQTRLEALDAIEAVQIKGSFHKRCEATSTAAMDASDMFNVQLMLEVFKSAYHAAWRHLQQLHSSWRELFGIPVEQQSRKEGRPKGEGEGDGEGEGEEMEAEEVGDVCTQMAEKQLDSAVTVYLRKVYTHQDITPMMKLLESQLDAKYFNHPAYAEAKGLAPFIGYMEECVKVAWGLCIQMPHLTINCKDTVYNPDTHKRFYNANKSMVDIIMYMWPTLTELNGHVLVPGIVLT